MAKYNQMNFAALCASGERISCRRSCVNVLSAESRDLFGNSKMWFIRTSKVGPDPLGQLLCREQAIGFNDSPFAMAHCGSMGLSQGLFVGKKQGRMRTPFPSCLTAGCAHESRCAPACSHVKRHYPRSAARPSCLGLATLCNTTPEIGW